MFKPQLFQEQVMRVKLRGKLKDAPTKIIKIVIEECERILEKRTKRNATK